MSERERAVNGLSGVNLREMSSLAAVLPIGNQIFDKSLDFPLIN
jgi:hypothetical protein